MSGVDIALWDIKGKRANMPLYQLLGGKVRFGADLYFHASGRDFQQVEENARRGMEMGYRYIRVQGGVPGLATYGARGATPAAANRQPKPLARPTRTRTGSGNRRLTSECSPNCLIICGRNSARRLSYCTTCTSV